MELLDPEARYALLAYITPTGEVLDQRAIPTQTFNEIAQGSRDCPYAVTLRGQFYLFSTTQFNVVDSVLAPTTWLRFSTREAAIEVGRELVTGGLVSFMSLEQMLDLH